MSLKHEFVRAKRRRKHPGALSALPISPSTAYQLLDRYEQGRALAPSPSLPEPDHELEAVLAVRDGHPVWGGRDSCRPRTCPAPALSRRSCVGTTGLPPTSQPRATGNGSSTPSPMTCGRWTSRATSPPEQAASPLDCPRRPFPLRHRVACVNERTLQECLTAAFRTYGLPARMLMDNGSPWGNDALHPRTPLTCAASR